MPIVRLRGERRRFGDRLYILQEHHYRAVEAKAASRWWADHGYLTRTAHEAKRKRPWCTYIRKKPAKQKTKRGKK